MRSTTSKALIPHLWPSLTIEKADKVAEDFNTPKFDSLDELLAYLDANSIAHLDGALVCNPNHLHAPIAVQLAA